jgi:tetratricopeptide (TPR) repeat protein
MALRHVCASLFVVLAWMSPAAAQPEAATPLSSVMSEVRTTEADIRKSGILTVKDHVDALETALRNTEGVFPSPPPAADGTITVLTDGPTETLAVLAAVAKDGRHVVAVINPYPRIGLYLGVYYNEVGKPEEALRVIDAGLKLTPNDMGLGATLASLYGEKAAAFANEKRWTEDVVTCDTGLALPAATVPDRALLYRNRGFALVELGRLDDGTTSYQESLKLEPGNPIATRELAYIARLRAGGVRAPTEQILPPAPPPQPNSAPKASGPQPT